VKIIPPPALHPPPSGRLFRPSHHRLQARPPATRPSPSGRPDDRISKSMSSAAGWNPRKRGGSA